MKTVTIDTRAEGKMGHSGPINEIVVREPTLAEYIEHGEPILFNHMPNGEVFTAENSAAIQAYVRCCVIEPKDPLAIERMSLRAGRELRKAIIGFFLAAPPEDEPS